MLRFTVRDAPAIEPCGNIYLSIYLSIAMIFAIVIAITEAYRNRADS
jgi:hypothetical protein